MNKDLTRGPVMRSMLWFALPMILGNLLQQCYNIADTLIVGRFLGKTALAAVGSSFSLMTFLTSILLGLCMGSGALFSIRFGQRDEIALKESVRASFVLILGVTLLLNGLAFACLDLIKSFLQVPDDVWGDMRAYIAIVFAGIFATFLYNYFASYLRAVGNSVVPLVFLAVSFGVAGAAGATVIAQYVSGIGIMICALLKCPQLRALCSRSPIHASRIREIAGYSILTCVQQSVMNLGILMVQGLVNSFGAAVMAAFAAAVKIDAFAYMPCAGLRQRVLHIHRTELRCGQAGTHPQGIERCGSCIRCVLRDCVRFGVRVRKAAYAAVCGSGRNGDYRRGRALPAH